MVISVIASLRVTLNPNSLVPLAISWIITLPSLSLTLYLSVWKFTVITGGVLKVPMYQFIELSNDVILYTSISAGQDKTQTE